ncbi:MAG: hypothetical protein U0T69_05860 [Chitinophagales bacterium]
MQLKEQTNVSVYFELLSHLDDDVKRALIAHLLSTKPDKRRENPIFRTIVWCMEKQ